MKFTKSPNHQFTKSPWPAIGAAIIALGVAGQASALEFMADQITRINGHSRKANIYYRDDRWRLEHHDVGPVNVTIVRKDKQLMWLLLSRMKHFKTLPYDADQAPKVSERLDGEVAREQIGTEVLDGHPTILYLVTVRQGSAGAPERMDEYYQWLATDIHFPLKLAKKDGDWIVEYRHVKLKPQSDFLFQLPVNFQPLETFEQRGPPHPERAPEPSPATAPPTPRHQTM